MSGFYPHLMHAHGSWLALRKLQKGKKCNSYNLSGLTFYQRTTVVISIFLTNLFFQASQSQPHSPQLRHSGGETPSVWYVC